MTHQNRSINFLASVKVSNLLYRPSKKNEFVSSYRAVHFLVISKVLKMIKKKYAEKVTGPGTNSYQQPDLKLISEMKRLLSTF